MNDLNQATGYDGELIIKGDRVELHPGCDLWARGARYGTVVAIQSLDVAVVQLDKYPKRIRITSNRIRNAG